MTAYLLQVVLDADTHYGVIKNWRDIRPALKRHEQYRTIIPTVTLSNLELVGEAKDYVDGKYDTDGLHAVTSIAIHLLNPKTGDYEAWMTGELDYATYNYLGSEVTSIGVKPVDFVTKWLTNDTNTLRLQELTDVYGSAITPFAEETIELPLYSAVLRDVLDVTVTPQTLDIGLSTNEVDFGTDNININTFPNTGGVDNNEPWVYNTQTKVNPFPTTNFPVFAILGTEDLDITVEYDIDYLCELINGLGDAWDIRFRFRLEYFEAPVVWNELITEEFYADTGVNTSYTFAGNKSGTFTYTFSPTAEPDVRSLSLVAIIDYVPGGANAPEIDVRSITVNSLRYKITRDTTYPETTCQVMPAYEVLLRTLQQATGRNDALISDFFGRTDTPIRTYGSDGEGSLLVLTSGQLLRNFPLADYPLQMSFSQAFEILNALYNIGAGIEYVSGVPYVRVEPIEYFYPADLPSEKLQDPSGYQLAPALEMLYSDMKIGYTKVEKFIPGGINSGHGEREFATPLAGIVKNSADLNLEAVASNVLIETGRRKPYSSEDTDNWTYDEDIFLIQCRRQSGDLVPEKNENFTTVTGIPYIDRTYNLNLLPTRRLLKRHISTVMLAGFRKASAYLRYLSGTVNTDITTQRTGELAAIAEQYTDIPDATLLVEPELIQVTHPLTHESLVSLMAAPTTVIEVIWRGNSRNYHLQSLTVTDLDSKLCQLELIAQTPS